MFHGDISNIESFQIGGKIYVAEEKAESNKLKSKKLDKFIEYCDFINGMQVNKIGKEDVEHIKLDIGKLDSGFVREVLNKDESKKTRVMSAIGKVWEREFNALHESSLAKSKNRHTQNIIALDSWKYNIDDEVSLKNSYKEVFNSIEKMSDKLKKIPINKLHREDTEEMIDLFRQLYMIYGALESFEFGTFQLSLSPSEVHHCEIIIRKLIDFETMKLDQSHLESAINRHQSNIDNLNKIFKG